MFCASKYYDEECVLPISGEVPEEPVISKKTGYIYEKRLITKYIKTEGKCPITGEELDSSDLLDVKTQPIVKPKPIAASSIPGLLVSLQNEWDSLMLETFTLKKHLQAVRQELSQALYQHEAACRVIARLIKERDSAREALTMVQSTPVVTPTTSSMEVEDDKISEEMLIKMSKKAKESFKTRPKRRLPEDFCTEENMNQWVVQDSYTAHRTATPQVKSISHRSSQPDLVLSGGADNQVLLYDVSQQKITRHFTGHTKGVNSVILHPDREIVISASDDKTVRMWIDDERPTVFKSHTAEVTGLSLQACGDYFASASRDSTWCFYDIPAARLIQSVTTSPDTGSLECLQFHPDGLILASGTSTGIVQIWDMKSQSNVTNFVDHSASINSLSFSENGYYMASGADDGEVRLWDLRNGACVQSIESSSAVRGVSFDYTGSYLAICSDQLRVMNTKTWSTCHENKEDVGGYYCAVFGSSAKYLLVGCGNRSIMKLGN